MSSFAKMARKDLRQLLISRRVMHTRVKVEFGERPLSLGFMPRRDEEVSAYGLIFGYRELFIPTGGTAFLAVAEQMRIAPESPTHVICTRSVSGTANSTGQRVYTHVISDIDPEEVRKFNLDVRYRSNKPHTFLAVCGSNCGEVLSGRTVIIQTPILKLGSHETKEIRNFRSGMWAWFSTPEIPGGPIYILEQLPPQEDLWLKKAVSISHDHRQPPPVVEADSVYLV